MIFSVIQWHLNNIKTLRRITTQDVIIETQIEEKTHKRSASETGKQLNVGLLTTIQMKLLTVSKLSKLKLLTS
jgi:hypothetical protein